MMRTLRKKTRFVLFVALAGFVLLIFFRWGLDITGIQTRTTKNIVEIDGIPIEYTDYYRFAQLKEREYRGITRDEIWAMLIDEIMWNNLIRKEKIRISNEEIWAIIQNNPPREIYESEFMKNENGEFDFNKYNELLRAPQSRQWLLEYEYSLRTQLPREKLRSLISTMGWVSPFEDSLTIVFQTTRYDLSFMSVPLFRLRGLVGVSEKEMREYFDKNRAEFITPEAKILKYVFFERKPSQYDTSEARERMEDFILRINEGEDYLAVAQEVSDDSVVEIPVQSEIDLKPYLMNVYKELKNGETSDIIQGPGGFEVIKRVHRGLVHRAKANIQVSTTTLGEIRDNIEAFKEMARESGFDSAAVYLDLPIRKTYPLREDNVTFPVRNTTALSEFLSRVKKEEIGGPFGSLGGYYLFTIDSIIPETEPTFEEMMPRMRVVVEKEKLDEQLDMYLSDISNQLMSGVTMEQIAARDTLIVFRNNLKDFSLNQIQTGYGEEFAGMVSTLEPKQISPPLVMEWAGYIIRCDRKVVSPFDSTMVALLQIKRQMRLQQLTQSIFTPKEIEDNRDLFFE